ncbi:MAG: helix-turn-helix transcriptional regulator [Christiangramia sp.]|uniref:helix-turn-helix domain-containing protein n=1 Tax=Christiangramia sp. TaxID=1931228 RepID=UPI003241EEB0
MSILRLGELLDQKGFSGKYLAEQVDVTPATISNIKKGNHFPKEDLLIKIAEVLGVEVRDLFKTNRKLSGQPIYVEQDGKYIKVGELKLDRLDEGSVAG